MSQIAKNRYKELGNTIRVQEERRGQTQQMETSPNRPLECDSEHKAIRVL
jgi:hypothetical protein